MSERLVRGGIVSRRTSMTGMMANAASEMADRAIPIHTSMYGTQLLVQVATICIFHSEVQSMKMQIRDPM